ncbi:hypothetical protein [Paenibacillus segetis]|uniref:hypothetical protein n=1 Tax=Paenibacillus segetis TaxID=1325360 RepID=UPI001889BD6C
MGDVTIGKGCVIAAKTVLKSGTNYLQYSILASNPNFCIYHQRLFGGAGNSR